METYSPWIDIIRVGSMSEHKAEEMLPADGQKPPGTAKRKKVNHGTALAFGTAINED